MTLAVLSTKLFAPLLRDDHVSRPRLIHVLREGSSRKLTMVSAPAGFGKTTLVIDWLKQQPTSFVWYQLDEADSDPARFMGHLCAGIRQHIPDFGMSIEGIFQGQVMPSPEALFTELINDIMIVQQPLTLVLDDYHRIDSTYINEGIRFLLQNQPATLHLVMITREDPDLPLASMRGQGTLTEIRASHLRFTSDESRTFLKETMQLSLSKASIQRLDERTEGWIAGLQLAGLSLAGRTDQSSVINNFRGDDRYVVDYLISEVLQQQDEHIQNFLLKTSILDTLESDICDELTGRDDSHLMLETIESANLFLIPLDNRRQTYRYHHLFADLLRHQLQVQYGDDALLQLHRQASDWYHQQENAIAAIHHAIQTQDNKHVADLISHYRLKFLTTGEWYTMGQLLKQLPGDILDSRPDLMVARAWEMLSSAQMHELVAYVDKILPHLDDPHLTAETAILKGYLMLWRNEPHQAIAHSKRALDNLELSDNFLRSFALNNLGFAYRAANMLDEAAQVFDDVERLFGADHDIVHLRITVNAQANIHSMRGDLRQAKQVFERALDRYANSPFSSRMLGLLYIGLGNIAYEWNELEEAEQHYQMAFAGWSRSELAKEVMHGYMHLAFVYQAQNKPDEAQQSLQSGWDMAKVIVDHAFNVYINAYQARLNLLQERWTEVAAWAKNLPLDTDNPQLNDFTEYSYLTLARWWLKDNKSETLQKVQFLLQPMIELADETGRDALKAEALLLQALLAQALDEQSLAIEYLTQSLTTGHQFKRLYINEGEPLRSLMAVLVERKNLPTALIQQVNDLLGAFPKAESTSAADKLVEPLTDRELDVLQHLAVGKSNRQIADELFVSVGTVKTHARHIYEKLSVNNRTHAVARARNLGLLQ